MEKLGRFPVHCTSLSGTWKTGSVCNCKSHIVDDTILLRDWYLIKSPKAHTGKRLAVGGILSKGDVKNFQSAPIIQRLNAFRLRTADGLIILLVGLMDAQRTTENGFPSEIGFPFTWETLANVYIRSDDTSCSSLGHDNDVKELVHSAGRARRVRTFSDDVKWSKSDSADGPENDRSMQSSFARKIEDKSGTFPKGPTLHMGPNPKNFSPSDAWKSKDKGNVHEYNISSSGCALGNIQNFDDDDGKMPPDDGGRCVKNCLDEAIPNQTLLDTLNGISMGISYKNEGMQPDHECWNVNSDMEENATDKPSPVKGTGNSYYVASVSAGQSVELTPNTVICPGSHEVGYAANTGFDKGCNSLPKAPECSSDLLNANIPIENLRGGNGNVVKDPEIQNVSSSEIMYLSESGIVIPLVSPFKCMPARSAPSPVVLTYKKVPCPPGKVTPIDAKNGVFVERSVGERIRDAAKLAIGGCTTRSNSKTIEGEHVESENDSLLQSPVKRTKTSQLGWSKELSQRGAQMMLESVKVTGKDASSVAPSKQRVTRSRARSSSFEGLEKEEQIGGSGLKDVYNKDATIPMDCPKDALLEMDGSTSSASEFLIAENKDKMGLGAKTTDSSYRITRLRATSSSSRSLQKEGKQGCSTQQDVNGEDIAVSISCSQDTFLNMVSETSNSLESEPGKNKDKMGLGAKNFDSGKRITISTAMSSSLRCSRKEGEGDCHIQKDTSSVDVTASKSCFKGAVCDRKSGATEIGVGKIKNQGSLDAKTHDSDELLNLSNTIGHGTAKRKLQYGHATDLRTQHAGKHLLSAVGRNQIEGLVAQGSEVSDDLKEFKRSGSETVAMGRKKKRKTHVQHACRPFVPSSSIKKSSAPGKALNLKMSRSGRLIVPPLAHWRNEQIVYDAEGEITCIFDGSQVIKRPGTHSGNIITRSRKPQGS